MTFLQHIEAELLRIANDATDENPIDPFDVKHVARLCNARAEMEALGLVE